MLLEDTLSHPLLNGLGRSRFKRLKRVVKKLAPVAAAGAAVAFAPKLATVAGRVLARRPAAGAAEAAPLPEYPGAVPYPAMPEPVPRMQPAAFRPAIEPADYLPASAPVVAPSARLSTTPPWLLPVAIGGAALVLPMLLRK